MQTRFGLGPSLIKSVGMSLGKLIQKGRQDKGITQKELATKVCEKPQVVNEYEQGKGIPNNQIMIKLEKALGIKLRGKDKGITIAILYMI